MTVRGRAAQPDRDPLTLEERLAELSRAVAALDAAPATDDAAREEDTDAWQVTYLDTVTLVLSLFAFIISLMQLPSPQRAAIANAIQSTIQYPGLVGFPDVLIDVREAESIPDVGNLIRAIESNGLQRQVSVAVTKNQAELLIGASVLFAPGDDALSPGGIALLRSLGAPLSDIDGRITVEGHTDNTPLEAGRFATNWHLSAARAIAVVRFLGSLGIPEARFRVAAYGDTAPIADNATPEGRAANRRVSIRIELAAGSDS